MIEHPLQKLRPLRADIGLGSATLADFDELPLYPQEARHTTDMLPCRKCDFWMGRSAARRALSDLGADPGPVLANHRWPTFPAGTVGSVSHSSGVAVAIVGSAMRFRSMGVDLELRPLDASAARLVLGPTELGWFAAGERTCAEAFSAKEAAFKALDPLLDGGAPQVRQIRLSPAEGGFDVQVTTHPQVRWFVSIQHLSGGILAWMVVS